MVLQTDKSAGSTTALHRQGRLPSPAAVPRGSALGETLGGGETEPVSASRLVPKRLVSACQVPRQESMVSGLTTPPQYEGANADWGAGAVLSLSRGQRGPARASKVPPIRRTPPSTAPAASGSLGRRGSGARLDRKRTSQDGRDKETHTKDGNAILHFLCAAIPDWPAAGSRPAVHAVHRPLAPRSGPYVS